MIFQSLKFLLLATLVASTSLVNTHPLEQSATTTAGVGSDSERQHDVANTEHDDCSICLESLQKGRIVNIECGHKFHKDCMDEWGKDYYTSCPICRKSQVWRVLLDPPSPFIGAGQISRSEINVMINRHRRT